MTAPTVDWAAECEVIWAATEAAERADRQVRREDQVIRLWNGDWKLKHLITDFYSSDFNPIDNDTGTHELVLPWEDPAVQWAYDEQERLADGDKQNIHVSCDYAGARICGRLDRLDIETDEWGRQKCRMTFLDDYENLKWYDVWSNPFLPAAFQFPRVFIVPGPLIWALKLTLFLQLLRENVPLLSWSMPDDPVSGAGWVNLDQSTWEILVKPTSLNQDLNAGSIWGVVSSRWKNFHDMSLPMVEDAEYSWKLRRWFAGDEVEPWMVAAGITPRHGALIVDLVDKSGVFVGTSHGGTMFDGLARTIGDFTEDFMDSTFEAISDEEIPGNYYTIGNRRQEKERPFVTYTPDMPGVKAMTYSYFPAKGVVINCGGHSMPGVNELISAGIQAIGDIVGNALLIGSIGGSIDTLLRPFYEDTVLAWMSVKVLSRSMKQGTGRYFEYFQSGADKAYTIQSMMVLRTGIWATRTRRANKMEITDGGPFLIGDMGLGHFWLGDRVGGMIPGDLRRRIYMDRVRSLSLSCTRGKRPQFEIVVGDNKADEDPWTAAWGRIEGILGAVKELGVF